MTTLHSNFKILMLTNCCFSSCFIRWIDKTCADDDRLYVCMISSNFKQNLNKKISVYTLSAPTLNTTFVQCMILIFNSWKSYNKTWPIWIVHNTWKCYCFALLQIEQKTVKYCNYAVDAFQEKYLIGPVF